MTREVVQTGIRDYLRPASIEEAWAALAERGKAAEPIGGGIDAMLYATPETTAVIDLAGTGLSYAREEDGLVIGATTTFTEIIESPLAPSEVIDLLLGGLHQTLAHGRVAGGEGLTLIESLGADLSRVVHTQQSHGQVALVFLELAFLRGVRRIGSPRV